MSLFRLLVVTALYYGYTKFKSIMPSKKSSVEDRKDYSGKLKGRKVLYKGDADLPKVIVEAAIKCCFLEKQATPKPSPTEKQLRFKTLLLSIIAGCAGLSILIWRRTARHNQDQTQAAPLPLNISPEKNLRVFLTGEAGQILNVEDFLTALGLHHYVAILHGQGLLHATFTELMEAGLEETPTVQIMTGVRFLYGLNHRSFILA